MEINTYAELVNEIRRLREEQNHLDDVQRQLNETNLDPVERSREQQSITTNMRNTTSRLNELLAMQNAYNIMLENIRALRNIDVERAPDREAAEEWVSELSDAIVEARTHLPENLQQEIRDRILMNSEEFERIVPQAERPVERTPETPTRTAETPTRTVETTTRPEPQTRTTETQRTTTPQRDAATPRSTPSTPDINYESEYEKIRKEFDEVLGDRDLSEAGLSELESISEKYTDINERRQKLRESLEEVARTSHMNSEDLRELLDNDHEFQEKIESSLSDIQVITEEKEAIKDQLEDEIKAIEDKIKFTQEQITDLEDKINQLVGNPLHQPQVDKYRELATKLQETIVSDEAKIKELKEDLNKIINGGKIELKDMKEKVQEVEEEIKDEPEVKVEETPEKEPEKKPEEKKPEEKKPEEKVPTGPTPIGTAAIGPAHTAAPVGPTPAADLPNTLENLQKKGVLPKNFTPEELLEICEALNIPVSDLTTVISKEQIDRLTNDHQIQTALINQKIFERNEKKISEYDKLIAKYKTMLETKMGSQEFSEEYIEKVGNLITKLETERDSLIQKNSKITAFDRSTVVRGTSSLSDNSLDAKAMDKNDKLRKQYEKLDSLREERKEATSKFKQRKQDARIERTLNRIERLKQKKATIVSKQTQIVNSNSDKYIERMSSKLHKQASRQSRIEQNVDRINEISSRIEQSNMEKERLAADREKETRVFDRIGMAIENRRLASEINSLENQRDFQDFVGRHR